MKPIQYTANFPKELHKHTPQEFKFGEIIEKARIRKNMTQEDLCKALQEKGITLSTGALSKLEHEIPVVSEKKLQEICAFFGFSQSESALLITKLQLLTLTHKEQEKQKELQEITERLASLKQKLAKNIQEIIP